MLYVWSTKELKEESKITEAYDMLKKQGIITEDPKYVGDAVFASALPPRKSAPLNSEQTQKLRTLLQVNDTYMIYKYSKTAICLHFGLGR